MGMGIGILVLFLIIAGSGAVCAFLDIICKVHPALIWSIGVLTGYAAQAIILSVVK